eukprot:g9978.t1
MADIDELQSVGSDRSRQSSLASLADDLTKRSTYSHRLGLGLDRALDSFHAPAAAATAKAASTSDNQFLSTAAAVATGTASGFGGFRVPIQSEERSNRLSSLAEAAGDDAEEEQAQAPPDAPMLQARVSMPDSVSGAEPDRRQWLKQQSRSRRRRRSSSSKGKRSSSSSSRGRSANAYDGLPSSRESSLARGDDGGDDDSDASSVVSAGSSVGSTNSRLSIVSTPEVSSWRQRQMRQQHHRVKSSDRAGSVSGFATTKRNKSLSSSSLSLSGLQGFNGSGGRGGGGGGMQPRGTLSRTSSSSSISSMVSSSLLRWCSVCEAEFTRLRRPHRCRRCLEAVCAPCSPARLPVPGSGSSDPRRTCKLCARESLAPQVGAVVSPERGRPSSPTGSVRSRSSRSSQRRSASMGNIPRAPFGVLSKPAAPVLYPVAAAGAGVEGTGAAIGAAGGEGGVGSNGGLDGGGFGEGRSDGGDHDDGAGEVDFGLRTPAADAYHEAEAVRHDSESEHWESAEEGDREDWPSVAALAARIENPAAGAAGAGSSSKEGEGLEEATVKSSGVPREEGGEEAEAPVTAVEAPPPGTSSELDDANGEGETPLVTPTASSDVVLEAGSEVAEPSPHELRSMATPSTREEGQKRGIFGFLFGKKSSKPKAEVPDVPAPAAPVPFPSARAGEPQPETSGQVSAADDTGSLPSASPNAPAPGVEDLSVTGASEPVPDKSGPSPAPGAGDSPSVVVSAGAPTSEADISLPAETSRLPGTTHDDLPGSDLGGSAPSAAGDAASGPTGQGEGTSLSAPRNAGADGSIAKSAPAAAATGVAALGGAIGAGAGLVGEETPPEEADDSPIPVGGGPAVGVGAAVSEVAEDWAGTGSITEETGSVLPAEEAPGIDATAADPAEAAVEVAVAEHVIEAGGGAPDREPDALDLVAASQADDDVLSPTHAGGDDPSDGNADMTVPTTAAVAGATAVAETVTDDAAPRLEEAENAAAAAAAAAATVSETGGAEAEQPIAGEETAGAAEMVSGSIDDAQEGTAAMVSGSDAAGAQVPEASVAASPQALQDAISPNDATSPDDSILLDVSVEQPQAAASEAGGSPPPAATALSGEEGASVDDKRSMIPDEARAFCGPGESRPVAGAAVHGVDGDAISATDIVGDGDVLRAAPPVDGGVSPVDAPVSNRKTGLGLEVDLDATETPPAVTDEGTPATIVNAPAPDANKLLESSPARAIAIDGNSLPPADSAHDSSASVSPTPDAALPSAANERQERLVEDTEDPAAAAPAAAEVVADLEAASAVRASAADVPSVAVDIPVADAPLAILGADITVAAAEDASTPSAGVTLPSAIVDSPALGTPDVHAGVDAPSVDTVAVADAPPVGEDAPADVADKSVADTVALADASGAAPLPLANVFDLPEVSRVGRELSGDLASGGDSKEEAATAGSVPAVKAEDDVARSLAAGLDEAAVAASDGAGVVSPGDAEVGNYDAGLSAAGSPCSEAKKPKKEFGLKMPSILKDGMSSKLDEPAVDVAPSVATVGLAITDAPSTDAPSSALGESSSLPSGEGGEVSTPSLGDVLAPNAPSLSPPAEEKKSNRGLFRGLSFTKSSSKAMMVEVLDVAAAAAGSSSAPGSVVSESAASPRKEISTDVTGPDVAGVKPDAIADAAPGAVDSSPAVADEAVDGDVPPATVGSPMPDKAAASAAAIAVEEPSEEVEGLVDDKASEVAAMGRTGAAVEEIELAADDEPAVEVARDALDEQPAVAMAAVDTFIAAASAEEVTATAATTTAVAAAADVVAGAAGIEDGGGEAVSPLPEPTEDPAAGDHLPASTDESLLDPALDHDGVPVPPTEPVTESTEAAGSANGLPEETKDRPALEVVSAALPSVPPAAPAAVTAVSREPQEQRSSPIRIEPLPGVIADELLSPGASGVAVIEVEENAESEEMTKLAAPAAPASSEHQEQTYPPAQMEPPLPGGADELPSPGPASDIVVDGEKNPVSEEMTKASAPVADVVVGGSPAAAAAVATSLTVVDEAEVRSKGNRVSVDSREIEPLVVRCVDVRATAAAPEPATMENVLASPLAANLAPAAAAAAAAAAVTASIPRVVAPASGNAEEAAAAVGPSVAAWNGAGVEEEQGEQQQQQQGGEIEGRVRDEKTTGTTGGAAGLLEDDGVSSPLPGLVLYDETALFPPAAGLDDEQLRSPLCSPTVAAAAGASSDDDDSDDVLLPVGGVDDEVVAPVVAGAPPAVAGPGAGGVVPGSVGVVVAAASFDEGLLPVASVDDGLLLPAASVDDDAIVPPVVTAPSSEGENPPGDEDQDRTAAAAAASAGAMSCVEITSTLLEASPKQDAAFVDETAAATPDTVALSPSERNEDDEVPEINIEGDDRNRRREGAREPEAMAEPGVSARPPAGRVGSGAQAISPASTKRDRNEQVGGMPAPSSRRSNRGVARPASKAGAAGRVPKSGRGAVPSPQPAPRPMPMFTMEGRVRPIASPAVARAGGRPAAGQAGGGGVDGRDWLDELIDLFVLKCSTCIGDDGA